MACYAGRARDLRAAMAGSPDATSLPPKTGDGSKALDLAVKEFEGIQTLIDDGLKEAEAAHYGRAADSAQASIDEIKPYIDHAKNTSTSLSASLNSQAGNQGSTFNSLPHEGGTLADGRPTQLQPPEKNWADEHGMGWTWWGSDYEDKQERFQATNAEANRVMTAYSNQTDGVVGGAAEFKPPEGAAPPPPAPATYGQSAGSAMAGSSYSSGPSMGGGGGAPSGTSSAWAGSPSGGGYTPSPSPSPSQVPAGTGSAWAGSPSGGGGLPPGTVRGPDGTLWKQGPNGQWLRQNPYNGRWAPAPSGGPGGGRAGGGGAAGRGGAGAGGGRAGGGFGPRGSGGAGGANPLGAGGRSGGGFGPSGSGAPSSSTSAASSSSSGGRGGMARGMGGAGGQQQGGDEEEHERPSWLVETEDVFTNDMDRVAPPVLGALPDEEQGR